MFFRLINKSNVETNKISGRIKVADAKNKGNSMLFDFIFKAINKNIKATNYQIDTYKRKIYIYGISMTEDEKNEVISEAKEILDVEDIIASILLVENLRIQKN